jgi:uncharacterized protein (TIGR02588 family)
MSTSEKTPARKRRSTGSRARSSAPRRAAGSKRSGTGSGPGSSGSESGSESSRPEDNQVAFGLKRDRTPFEWALLAVAVVAIGSVVVGLFRYAGQKSGGQAELTVEVQGTGKQVDGGPQVEVTVRNSGGSGAEQVVTEVKMGGETREVTMTRIPKDDHGTALVTFPAGTSGTPEGELLSYNQP